MMLEKYCKDNNYTIKEIYIDDGVSGLTFERSGFQRMLKDIEAGKINMVITKDLSRLGRDYLQTGYYTEQYFPLHNVRYIAVNDGVDTLIDNNDIAPFKNILNDMYAKDLSRKVKSAKRQRALNGLYISAQPPYGYIKDPSNKNHLVVDEDIRHVIELIFKLSKEGNGAPFIAKYLEEHQILSPSAYKSLKGDTRFDRYKDEPYKWKAVTVRKILTDIVYCGHMENHKYEVKNYKTKKCTKVPKEEHIIVRNTHEAIISRSDFEHVQELIRHRQRPSRHNHPNLFKGLIKCENCGRTLNLYYNKRRDGRLVWGYRCIGNSVRNGIDTEANTIRYLEIYNVVKDKIKSLITSLNLSDDVFLNTIIEKANTDDELQKLVDEKNKLLVRLQKIEKIVIKLYEDLIEENLSSSNYQKMLDKYQEEQKEINNRLNEIEDKFLKNSLNEKNILQLKHALKEYLNFDELTPELINSLIDHITLSHIKVIKGVKTRNIKIAYKYVS